MMADTEQIELLQKDLSLVLPAGCLAVCANDDVAVGESAAIAGKTAEVSRSMERAAELIRQAKSPAIVGLNGLTIEGVRLAVGLGHRIGAKLFPSSFASSSSRQKQVASLVPAQMTATLGEAIAADLKIGHRDCDALKNNPIDAYIADHVPNHLFVEQGLDALLTLRQQIELRGSEVITETTSLEVKRAVVVLPACADARVISLWQLIACKVQRELRLAVVLLPNVETAGNLAGAAETLTWLTGVAPTRGGLDFSGVSVNVNGGELAMPKPCADADVLTEQGAIDLVIDFGLRPAPRSKKVKHWIRVGGDDDGANPSDVHLKTLGLAMGLRGRVMRFDGVVLWLCADPSPTSSKPGDAKGCCAIDDPAVALMSQLLEAVGGE